MLSCRIPQMAGTYSCFVDRKSGVWEGAWIYIGDWSSDVCSSDLDAFVIGEPVSLIGFGYDGNVRRGLSARCRRADGAEYEVAAADVILSSRTPGGCYLAAYRRWLGLTAAS